MDGNDDDLRLTIGQLARRTGLSVKTIRWYSDQGLVPPAGRTAAGYRLSGVEALARLELVRTLRRLGIDLRTIERDRHRPTRGALLATPGNYQRVAADSVCCARLRVGHRRAACFRPDLGLRSDRMGS
jgi:hypothetical protein